jgi:multiple sugar transport system permease protein
MMRRTGLALRYAGLVLGAGAAAAPLVWMVSASLMPSGEATTYPPRLLPSVATVAHYERLFGALHVGQGFRNSLVIASGATIVSLLVNSAAGYALAKLEFRGRDQLWRLLLAGLVVPTQVTMLPLFLLLRALGLVNTYLGAIVPSMASIFGIFLVRQYALSIPDDILNAARLEGASELRIYWSIVMPSLRPILATLAVFTFLTTWNDFLWPLVVLTDQSKYTLPVTLAVLTGEHLQDTELVMAGAVVTVLPVLALFLLLQRYYVEGIMVGSVKG